MTSKDDDSGNFHPPNGWIGQGNNKKTRGVFCWSKSLTGQPIMGFSKKKMSTNLRVGDYTLDSLPNLPSSTAQSRGILLIRESSSQPSFGSIQTPPQQQNKICPTLMTPPCWWRYFPMSQKKLPKPKMFVSNPTAVPPQWLVETSLGTISTALVGLLAPLQGTNAIQEGLVGSAGSGAKGGWRWWVWKLRLKVMVAEDGTGFRGEMMLVHSLCSQCQIARWPNRKWSRSQQAMAAMIPWCYFFLVSVRARLWVIQPRVFFARLMPATGQQEQQLWIKKFPKNAWHPTLPVREDPRLWDDDFGWGLRPQN